MTMRFLKCFCSSIFKGCLLLCFSPTKRNSISIQPLCVCSLRDGQTYVKCSACGTFKPRARRAHDFQLQSSFFQEAMEGPFNSRGGIPGGRCFGIAHCTDKSLLHESLGWRAGALSLKKTPKQYFSDMQPLFF